MAAIPLFMGDKMATLTSCESQNLQLWNQVCSGWKHIQNKVTTILGACFAMCCGDLHEFTSALLSMAFDEWTVQQLENETTWLFTVIHNRISKWNKSKCEMPYEWFLSLVKYLAPFSTNDASETEANYIFPTSFFSTWSKFSCTNNLLLFL